MSHPDSGLYGMDLISLYSRQQQRSSRELGRSKRYRVSAINPGDDPGMDSLKCVADPLFSAAIATHPVPLQFFPWFDGILALIGG